nr:hypothetical protein [Bradyrhizobium sp. BTAi1]
MVVTIDLKDTEWRRDGLNLLVEWIVENGPVQIPHQVNKATLLQAGESVVGRKEVGDQHAFEISKHLPQKATLA